MNKSFRLIAGTLFFWAGFVCSISFMEAWLKFRAPGVTLPIGLSIGNLVFTALNRMEWVFALLLIIWIVPVAKKIPASFYSAAGIILTILLLQTFWLLPQLVFRSEQIIAGIEPEESKLHLIFGIAELIKVGSVLFLGYYSGRLKTK